MRKTVKNIICILMAVVMASLLCGYTFFRAAATLEVNDTKENYIYQAFSLDTISNELKSNSSAAERDFKNQRIVTAGTIKSKASDSRLVIASEKGATVEINIKSEDVKDEVIELNLGDKVKVYGKGVFSLLGSSMSIEADKLLKVTSDKVADGVFEFMSGKQFNMAMTTERSLGGGRMKIHIPNEWLEVENQVKTDIGGYQYKLNEISSSYKTEPEQAYFFYFSNEKYLMNASDKENTEAIEIAIIENILRGENVGMMGIKTMKADYGTTYQYYDSKSFLDSNRKGHNVEFVFSKDGDKGIRCIMYVYNESHHKEDILFVMRNME